MVGEAPRDVQQSVPAGRAIVRDRGLEQVAGAVELVVVAQIGPAPVGADDLVERIQVPVGSLGTREQVDHLVDVAADGRVVLLGEHVRRGLQPLVEVGVGEPQAPVRARDAPGGDRDVVEHTAVDQLAVPVRQRLVPVHGTGARPEAVLDRDAVHGHAGQTRVRTHPGIDDTDSIKVQHGRWYPPVRRSACGFTKRTSFMPESASSVHVGHIQLGRIAPRAHGGGRHG